MASRLVELDPTDGVIEAAIGSGKERGADEGEGEEKDGIIVRPASKTGGFTAKEAKVRTEVWIDMPVGYQVGMVKVSTGNCSHTSTGTTTRVKVVRQMCAMLAGERVLEKAKAAGLMLEKVQERVGVKRQLGWARVKEKARAKA